MKRTETLHLRISRRAMATEFEILLHRDAGPRKVDAAVAALDRLELYEQQWTVYSAESEVSRINQRAASGPVRIGAMTLDILCQAQEYSRETDGAFDVTAGPLIDVWGFTKRSGRRPSAEEVRQSLAQVGWRHLHLDPDASTVRMDHEGMRINLGAIGKGYALDRIAQELRQADMDDFLLHGGNSSVIAWGDAEAGSARGWQIGLQHPSHPSRRLGGLWLRDAALATSGSGKQHFHFRGKRYGHVIDPRTGFPAGDMLSLTLTTTTAARADALATGLFVAGRAAVAEHAARRAGDGMIAVSPGERQGDVAVDVWNLTQDQWAPL